MDPKPRSAAAKDSVVDRQGGAEQGGRPGEVLARPRVVVGADDRSRVLGAHEAPLRAIYKLRLV